MFKLIKNAHIYSPEDLGIKDILICNNRIIDINENIEFSHKDLDVIDATGKIIIPGIIDQHVHLVGGGGEGGFKTRVPEVMLGDLIKSGITTVVGLLGTDTITRSVENLLAKTKALNEEGINAYCLTGGYAFPSPNVTGSIKKDITFITEILGVKLALSDHRAPLITKDELKKLASDTRVAGMFSGKSSYVKLHMGDGKEALSMVNEVLQETDIPITHFRPTHVGRKEPLFNQSMDFAKKGGIIDISADDNINIFPLPTIFTKIKENQVPLNNVTISSDGGGSWSSYHANGKLDRMGVAACNAVHKTLKVLKTETNLTFEEIISFATKNVANALGLENKGVLATNAYADLLILDDDLALDSVLVNGRMMMKNKELIVKGTYE